MPAVILNVKVEDSQAQAKIKSLNSEVNKLGNQRIGNPFDKLEGGSKSAFNSTRLLQTELRTLTSHIPVIGRLFSMATSDVFRFFSSQSSQIKKLENDLSRLESKIASASKKYQNRISDFGEGLRIRYDGNVDTAFLKKFGQTKDSVEKTEMLAGVGLSSQFTAEIDRAALQFQKLERDGQTALIAVETKAAATREKLAALRGETEADAAATAGFSTKALILAGVLTAVLAVAGYLGFKAASVGEEIYKVGQKTSFSTETLSVLRVQAQEAGNSFNEFSSALPRFEKNLYAAANGNKKLSETFQLLGVDVKNLSPEQAFKQFLVGFSRIDDESQRAAIAIQLFGKSGANLIPTFLRKGVRHKWKKMLSNLRRLRLALIVKEKRVFILKARLSLRTHLVGKLNTAAMLT